MSEEIIPIHVEYPPTQAVTRAERMLECYANSMSPNVAMTKYSRKYGYDANIEDLFYCIHVGLEAGRKRT